MNKLNELLKSMSELSLTLNESLDKLEKRIIEDKDKSSSKTINILRILEEIYNKRTDNLLNITHISKAKKIINIIDKK